MDRPELIQRLMATFLGELDEHVQALNRELLALERSADPAARAEHVQLLFRTAHSLKGAARAVDQSLIEGACHRLEGLLALARDGTLTLGPEVLQLLFAGADAIDDAAGRLRAGRPLVGTALEELLPRLAAAAGGGVAPAVAVAPDAPLAAAPAGTRSDSVRLAARRLDSLLARSGELLVARHRVESQADAVHGLQELAHQSRRTWRRLERPLRSLATAESRSAAAVLPSAALSALSAMGGNLGRLEQELDRLVAATAADRRLVDLAAGALDDEVRGLRMLPFSEASIGLARAIRDVAHAEGKELDLVLDGAAVAVDRGIVDSLRDPLLHLARNAVDHGIEPVAERAAAGKPRRATVRVAAALCGALVEVTVSDDGRGLDVEAIAAQARARGLEPPTDAAALARLLVLPGLSTRTTASTVSGRGVGLDVVKAHVDRLRGTLEVASTPGAGTTFTLRVPVTLTTARALLLRIAGQTFALAGTDVQQLLRVLPADVRPLEGRETVALGGAPVPLVSLAATLGLAAHAALGAAGALPVVVLAAGGRRVAFAVDELLAEREILVKGLGARLRRLPGIAGATILPSGAIALILNATDLVERALRRGATSETAVMAKRRLLVVDDSVTTRTLEKTLLETAGYDVTVAVDGAEGWTLLQERGADLVVADVEMPRMDGFALTAAIRGSPRFRDLPVVLVTARENDADKAHGLEVGADAYLLKSAFDRTGLLEAVAQLL